MRTRIKICGLTREEDVDAAVEAGADAIGLVFYAKSPRAISLDRAAALAARLPPFVMPVGLFVNAEPADISRACDAIPNLLLQFHGDETPADCEAPERPYLRAARVLPGFDLLDFAARYASAQAVLLDAHVDGYGGGGKVFDWSLLASALAASPRHGHGPASGPCPLVLSGGLDAANVAGGMFTLRPWAVDVSSGVERAPDGSAGRKGIKHAESMRRFCQAVREADERLAASARTDSATPTDVHHLPAT